MRMRFLPGDRFRFGLEIAVNHNRAPFLCGATSSSCSQPTDNGGTGVNCNQLFIAEKNLTAVWDFLGINRAMTVVQFCPIPSCPALALFFPVGCDPDYGGAFIGSGGASEAKK